MIHFCVLLCCILLSLRTCRYHAMVVSLHLLLQLCSMFQAEDSRLEKKNLDDFCYDCWTGWWMMDRRSKKGNCSKLCMVCKILRLEKEYQHSKSLKISEFHFFLRMSQTLHMRHHYVLRDVSVWWRVHWMLHSFAVVTMAALRRKKKQAHKSSLWENLTCTIVSIVIYHLQYFTLGYCSYAVCVSSS